MMLVNEGDQAPNFSLKADDGKKVSLSDFKGKKIILYFYPRDGTPGCTTEAIEFKNLARDFEKENVIIIGISNDNIQSHKKFKEKYDLPFTLLSDPESKVLNQYGVWKEKNLYGKKFMGTERTTFIIDEKGIVKKVYRKVKPKGHAQICLIDLKQS